MLIWVYVGIVVEIIRDNFRYGQRNILCYHNRGIIDVVI